MNDDLVHLTPDRVRSERTVARCHDALARRRRSVDRAARIQAKYSVGERVLVTAVSIIYLIAMAGGVIDMYR